MVDEVLAYLRCRSSDDERSGAERSSDVSENIEKTETVAGGVTYAAPQAEDAVFIDGTLGTAGHTLAMLEAQPQCRVVAFDRDRESMEVARRRLQQAGVLDRVTLVQGDFRHAPQLLQPFFDKQKVGADGRPITRIDGALVDAGMSLYQVSWGERGFSFRSDAPLDMRYDRTRGLTAFDLVNRLSSEELEELLFRFTDERWARRIAAFITDHRHRSPIRSTSELVSLIEAAIPSGVRRHSRVHPATKTFAALRLAVNDEFWALEQGSWALSSVLAPAARLVILTYSSNEDRIVKRTFRRLAERTREEEPVFAMGKNPHRTRRRRKPGALPQERNRSVPGRPVPGATFPSLTSSSEETSSVEEAEYSLDTFTVVLPTGENDGAAVPAYAAEYAAEWGAKWRMKIVTSRPVAPTDEEIERNPLARSCKLRAAEKVIIAETK